MKKTILIFAAIVMMAGLTTRTMAQVTLLGQADAGAELVKVLTIAQTTPLHFGVIGITAGTAGTVVMTTAGARTPNTLATTIINSGTQRTVALFSLTGTTDDIYGITMEDHIHISIGAGTGTSATTISDIMLNVDDEGEAALNSGVSHGQLLLGVSTFLLSGKLNIASDQVVGVYAGHYDVTVDYQ